MENKKHDMDWFIGILNDAKKRGINNFSFHEGGFNSFSPEIDEIGVSNLDGVTIYLKESKWDKEYKEKKEREKKEDFENKNLKRMKEIWNNSSEKVKIEFCQALLKQFTRTFTLNKRELRELTKTLNK